MRPPEVAEAEPALGRLDRARDDAHLPPLPLERRARPGALRQRELYQALLDLPAEGTAQDHLLPDVAALVERHRRLDERRLHRQPRSVDVDALARHAGHDAQHLQVALREWRRTTGEERVAEGGRLGGRQHGIQRGRTAAGVRKDAPGRRDGPRPLDAPRPERGHDAQRGRDVLQLHLVAQDEAREVSPERLRHLGLDLQEQVFRSYEQQRVRHHPALHVEEGEVDALAGR